MTMFEKTHEALFDELERQGLMKVDVGKLTLAVLAALEMTAARPQIREPYRRCANGACEE